MIEYVQDEYKVDSTNEKPLDIPVSHTNGREGN